MTDLNDKLNTWPAEIWLQHGADELPDYAEVRGSELTWCADSINASDVRYVRATPAPQAATSEPVALVRVKGLNITTVACTDNGIPDGSYKLYPKDAAPAAAHPAPSVKTWYERMRDAGDDGRDGAGAFMTAEIADLRAALSAQQAGVQEAQRWRYTQQEGYFHGYSDVCNEHYVGVQAEHASVNSSIKGRGKTLKEAIDAALASQGVKGGE